MKTRHHRKIVVLLVLTSFAIASNLFSQIVWDKEQGKKEEEKQYYTVAILPFVEGGVGLKGQGAMVSDLLFTTLTENPTICLVERGNLKKILEEMELNASGVVGMNNAVKIGQMSGAKIIITGSIFKMRNNTYLVAKIIGTETTKVLGFSVKGPESIDVLTEKLGKGVSDRITKNAKSLMPVIKDTKDIVTELKKQLEKQKKYKIYINITEQSLTEKTIDPAAQTELQMISKEVGFEVTENRNNADVIISGEAFSQFATRRGNLISVAARVELKATDQKENIIAVGAQSEMAVGLSEAVMGKKAIQEATAKLAERILPKLIKQDK